VQHHLIHLICGSTGAGKTNYALRLSDHLEGIRFSIDEWMATLFWMDTPQPLNLDVPAEERWRRVETRNTRKGETYQLGFDVTREMFDFVERLWEPPTHAEMIAYNGVRTSGI
jgi:predicted kinase